MMTKKLEITIKCSTPEEAQDILEQVAATLVKQGFDKYPNDIAEYESDDQRYGFHYDCYENTDGTDIYGNKIE